MYISLCMSVKYLQTNFDKQEQEEQFLDLIEISVVLKWKTISVAHIQVKCSFL